MKSESLMEVTNMKKLNKPLKFNKILLKEDVCYLCGSRKFVDWELTHTCICEDCKKSVEARIGKRQNG